MSDVQQFEEALGQFLLYRPALTKKEPDRLLFLALPDSVYHSLFDDSYFEEVAELYQLKLLIYNEKEKVIVQWKK